MKQEFTIDEIKVLYQAVIYLKNDLYNDMVEFTFDGKLDTVEARRVAERLDFAKMLQLKLCREIQYAEMTARREAFEGSEQ